MESQRLVTKEEVDKEIRRLKTDHRNGNGLEDTDLYRLKIKALETAKAIVKKRNNKWTKIPEKG